MNNKDAIYLVQGSLFKTLETLSSLTYVLVYNEIRKCALKNYVETKNKSILEWIIFLDPSDLEEHLPENFIKNEKEELLLVDEYHFFKEHELWNKVLFAAESFQHIIMFNSLKKNQIVQQKKSLYHENLFIHHLLFAIKFTRFHIVLICQNAELRDKWILCFQKYKISCKNYDSSSLSLSSQNIFNYQCHLILPTTHLVLSATIAKDVRLYSYKTNCVSWDQIFQIYNPTLSLPFIQLEKSNIWKNLCFTKYLDLIPKALFHRLWEFFYV